MEILVIDGQGGGLGKALVAALKSHFSDITVNAVGTNSIATQQMLRSGYVIRRYHPMAKPLHSLTKEIFTPFRQVEGKQLS